MKTPTSIIFNIGSLYNDDLNQSIYFQYFRIFIKKQLFKLEKI